MEEIVLKSLFDKHYSSEVFTHLKLDFFEDYTNKQIFKVYSKHLAETGNIPNKDVFDIELKTLKINDKEYEETQEKIKSILEESKNNPVENLEYIVKETEKWGLQRSVYLSIIKGIEEFDKDTPNFGVAYDALKEAIGYTFDKEIGLAYIDDAEKRFELYKHAEEKHPFGITWLDKATENGYESGTLNGVLAGTNGGKSIWLCDVASKSLSRGKNVLYLSLEMSEKNIMKRIDANQMNLPIYKVDKLDEKTFNTRINLLKDKINGELIVKQYPPRTMTSVHLRHLLDELKSKRGFIPDIICVDYLGIMDSATAPTGSNTYIAQKHTAEELRALAIELQIPIWTAVQTNRSGMDNSDVGISNIADSLGVAMTLDFLFSIYTPEELAENKQTYAKIIKSRYGEMDIGSVIGLDKERMTFYDCETTYDYSQSSKKKETTEENDEQSNTLENMMKKQQESKSKSFDFDMG